jgi:N-acetylmuramoyl-L-alanine amidase
LKKYAVELIMAGLLLISFFFLARQAAEVSGSMKIREKEMIAIDPGHGDMKMRR